MRGCGWRYIIHTERSGRASVRVRVRIRGRASDISTGIAIRSADRWNAARQRVKGSDLEAATANTLLSRIEGGLSALFASAAIAGAQPDLHEAAAIIRGGGDEPAPADTDDLLTVFDLFTASAGRVNSWTTRTFGKFASLRRHIEQYNPALRLSTLTADRLQGFTDHLASLGLRNTTITKLAEHVRWFLRWAAGNGYYSGNLHDTYRPKLKGGRFEQKAVIYLTIQELQRLEECDLGSRPELEAVRDVFVFGCYSGLRYSDLKALRKSDIHGGRIWICTQKTDDPLSIELNSHTAAILERWKGYDDRLALPALSNQRSNVRLKELGMLAGIDEPVRITYFKGSQRFDEIKPKWQVLTTHAARRTFVVTALTLGIPAEVVMKWTGHSDYKAMKPYIAIVDELKAEKMRLFDTLPAAAPPFAPPEDGRTESQPEDLKLTTGKKSP